MSQGAQQVVHVEPEIMGSGAVVQAQTAAEIDMQIATAKKYPRVISKVKERILELATVDKETAEACWYAVPRGDKLIEGPGVRLAEIVASAYGNLRAGTRVLAIEEKHVVCQGVCHDLETNTCISKEVRKKITDKHGRRFSEDMITLTANSGASVALRNAVFAVIPMATFKAEIDKVKAVGMGKERTRFEHIKSVVEYYRALNVEPADLLRVLKKRAMQDVTLEDVTTLRHLVTAIKEGTTTVAEAFGMAAGKQKQEPKSIPRAKLSPGDPATHEGHPEPGEAPKEEKPAEKPKAQPAAKKALSMSEKLAMARSHVKEYTQHLNPDLLGEVLDEAGIIEGLDRCEDLELLQIAENAARNLVEELQQGREPEEEQDGG